MAENKNVLANGMFVKEYTYKTGTKILNVSVNCEKFIAFCKDNYTKDKNGNCWTNIKIIPNKEIKDNGWTHTAILDTYYVSETKDELLEQLNAINSKLDKFKEDSPTKPVAKKRGRPAKAKADLPF